MVLRPPAVSMIVTVAFRTPFPFAFVTRPEMVTSAAAAVTVTKPGSYLVGSRTPSMFGTLLVVAAFEKVIG